MKLHCLQSGFIKSWRHLLVIGAAEGERVIVPIPFFLIEHPQGLVLFDAGQRVPSSPPDPNGNYVVLMTPEERAVEQLRCAGFMPESVTHIVLSHTHSDHVEGLPDLPDVKCYLQRKGPRRLPGGRCSRTIPANNGCFQPANWTCSGTAQSGCCRPMAIRPDTSRCCFLSRMDGKSC